MNPSVTPTACQLPLAREPLGCSDEAPLVKGGCLGLPRRGDSVAKATDLFTIHSSLFTKKLSLFHIGWYFEEVPTVNPSVKNQRFLPAPFGKGACGQCPQPFSHDSFLRIVTSLTRPVSLLRCSRCVDQSPPCQRGVVWRSQTGGIPRHCLGTSSLITLHYSLKSLPLSTWVCTLGKCQL